MDIQEVKNFHALAAIATPEEKANFSARLMKLHDDVITYPDLVEKFDSMSKEERKAIYAKLDEQTYLYPGAVPIIDGVPHPVFGRPFLALRAKMEYFRECPDRDRNGDFIFTPEIRQARIAGIMNKLVEILGEGADLNLTYGPKVEALKAALRAEREALENPQPANGSIWDTINGVKEA